MINRATNTRITIARINYDIFKNTENVLQSSMTWSHAESGWTCDSKGREFNSQPCTFL